MTLLRKNSIAYKVIISYLLLTIMNVSLFTFMIFENQLDLISQNAILESESKSTHIRIKMDAILSGKKRLDKNIINTIKKELRYLEINNFTIFKEDCEIITQVVNGNTVKKSRKTTKKEVACIIKSIQKNSFENRIFYHYMNRKKNNISLYVPINYGIDKTVVIKAVLSLKNVDKQMYHLVRQCIIIGIFIIFIHIIAAFFLIRAIINPIVEMSKSANKIAEGDLQARVNIIRNDEIGLLAISFNEMVVALERMRERDRGANPLTGFPGNISIAEEIESRLQRNEKMAVVYSDLDNFKAYNDKYGFTRGDDVILYSRDCFVEAHRSLDNDERIFLGHEGGDDFVSIVPMDLWEPFCKAVISFFDHDITQFYNDTDSKNGYIESISRQGQKMRFPLMTISLAVVSNSTRNFESYAEIVSVAAEMKKVVKKIEGSSYAIDRRKS